MTKQKIIYSRQVMLKLLEMGFRPIDSFQNPMNPKYLVWAFEESESFEKAFSLIVGGKSNGD